MLVEIAIADAYGAGFEFVAPADRELNDLSRYYPHPKSDGTAGRYTDDTQMSLALAEAVLDPDEPWTPSSLAGRFVSAYRRDPRNGYSSRVRRALADSSDGGELLRTINAQATSCGAAMRSVPLGLGASVEEVREHAVCQASVTHDTDEGRQSSVAIALAAHALGTGVPQASLDGWLADHGVGVEWLLNWDKRAPVANDAQDCVRAALSCLRGASSLSQALRDATALEGDVDSVAALAVGLGSLAPEEIRPDLPSALYEGLEDGPFGRAHLEAVDRELAELT